MRSTNVSFHFAGEVFVVAGGGSGIGAGLCHALSSAGAAVFAADIAGAAKVADEAPGPGTVVGKELDVSDPGAVRTFFHDVLSRHGRIDGLVVSAAIQPRTEIREMSDDEWQRVLSVNLSGALHCARAVAPAMIAARRGSIVTFTSGLATTGWARASAYATTKAGLIAFTKSLARELLPYGVRANVIAPGIIDTPIFTGPNSQEEQDFFRHRGGGVGKVADVVPLLMFLLCDASASLTGSVLDRQLALSLAGGLT